jgi:hypothetical protein
MCRDIPGLYFGVHTGRNTPVLIDFQRNGSITADNGERFTLFLRVNPSQVNGTIYLANLGTNGPYRDVRTHCENARMSASTRIRDSIPEEELWLGALFLSDEGRIREMLFRLSEDDDGLYVGSSISRQGSLLRAGDDGIILPRYLQYDEEFRSLVVGYYCGRHSPGREYLCNIPYSGEVQNISFLDQAKELGLNGGFVVMTNDFLGVAVVATSYGEFALVYYGEILLDREGLADLYRGDQVEFQGYAPCPTNLRVSTLPSEFIITGVTRV